jgi:hypothetical protein
MNVTDNKFNLAPRRHLDGVQTGSNYGRIKKKYDEEYMDNY